MRSPAVPRRLLSTQALPPSPLAPYRALAASGSQLRTGYAHAFGGLADGADRSAAHAVRAACRDGTHTAPTSGLAPGFVQANFVALPAEHAFEFLLLVHCAPPQ